ncbi:MAG: carbohydrate binding domain-containing protein, partial [Verrucomicrobiota bacterium]|nr:carbohydrate binding domain-containing protein [Verrucomicrobiota bacterium]
MNLVKNPGFEQGNASWADWGNAGAIKSNRRTGSYSMRNGSGARGRGQDLPTVRASRTYTLSGYGKVSIAGQHGSIGIHMIDANGSQTQRYLRFDRTGYVKKSVTFTTPAGTRLVRVWMWKQADAPAVFFADDLSVVEKLPVPPPATPPPPPPPPPPPTSSMTLEQYIALARGFDLAAVGARMGSTQPSDNRGADPEVPLAPIRLFNGEDISDSIYYNFGTRGTDYGIYWATEGQVLYVPDSPEDAGVDRVQIAAFSHDTLQLVPEPAKLIGSHPEPAVLEQSWLDATGGSLGRPLAIDRAGWITYSENGFMIFSSGLVGAGAVNNVVK